jgi:nucleoside phosphorylase/CheY-like chemotaxis protein
MKALLIEDNEYKANEIRQHLEKEFSNITMQLEHVTNAAAGLDKCETERFDLILLDLLIPPYKGDIPAFNHSISILEELKLSDTLNHEAKVVGITAYGKVLEQNSKKLKDLLETLILYSSESSEWRSPLTDVVRSICDKPKTMPVKQIAKEEQHHDLAIVTALNIPELNAILNLPCNWNPVTIENDSQKYFSGSITTGSQTLSVVAASAPFMGASHAAILTTKMIKNFTPNSLVMSGIAAGVKGKVNIGDILIAEHVVDYESGKLTVDEKTGETIFQPDPHPQTLNGGLLLKMKGFELDSAIVNEIHDAWPDETPRDEIKLRIGPIATGSAVLAHGEFVKDIIRRNRKLIGVEMETHGVYSAANYSYSPAPAVLSVKAVCDFANEEKNDDYQFYAAHNSAQFIYKIALSGVFPSSA